jgi:Rieske Fe-S protein
MENLSRRSVISTMALALTWITGTSAFGAAKKKPTPTPKKKVVTKKPTPSSSAKPSPSPDPSASEKPTPSTSPTEKSSNLSLLQYQEGESGPVKTVGAEQLSSGQSLRAFYQVSSGSAKVPILLHRKSTGDFLAFTAVCTHQGCIINDVTPKTFDCACHGSSYDSNTGIPSTLSPAKRPLTQYPVVAKEGSLFLERA